MDRTMPYPMPIHHKILYITIPYRTIPYTPCHNIYYPFLFNTTLYHVPYHTIPSCKIPDHPKKYHPIPCMPYILTIPYHSMQYHTIPYRTMMTYTMPYHHILSHLVLYRPILVPYHVMAYHTIYANYPIHIPNNTAHCMYGIRVLCKELSAKNPKIYFTKVVYDLKIWNMHNRDYRISHNVLLPAIYSFTCWRL